MNVRGSVNRTEGKERAGFRYLETMCHPAMAKNFTCCGCNEDIHGQYHLKEVKSVTESREQGSGGRG
jgi:hypothetical protein